MREKFLISLKIVGILGIIVLLIGLFIDHRLEAKTMFSVPVGKDGIQYEKGETEDTLTWGPPAFTVAPDGSFWIADTVGNRLLNYDANGNMQNKINLDDLDDPVVGVGDLEVTTSGVFVLDIAAVTPKVVHLSFSGTRLENYEIPESFGLENGLTGIAVGENNEILIELENGAQIYQLVDSQGKISRIHLEGYIRNGQQYTIHPSNLKYSDATHGSIAVDNKIIETLVTHNLGSLQLININEDNSFYIAVEEVGDDSIIQVDQTVRRYDATGKLTGLARVPISKNHTYIAHNVAVCPDKTVYVMTTGLNKVKIQRLRFLKSLRPILSPVPKDAEKSIESDKNGGTTSVVSYITRSSVISNANTYVNNRKYLNSTNINGTCAGRGQPGWLKGKKAGTYYSVAYDWGGMDSVSEYNSYMDSGYIAGDIDTDNPNPSNDGSVGVESCSRGVDCSGFVQRVWGITGAKLGTWDLASSSKVKAITFSELKSGDILNNAGIHVVLFSSSNSNGVYVYESVVEYNCDRVVKRNTKWTRYTGIYKAYRYNSIE